MGEPPRYCVQSATAPNAQPNAAPTSNHPEAPDNPSCRGRGRGRCRCRTQNRVASHRGKRSRAKGFTFCFVLYRGEISGTLGRSIAYGRAAWCRLQLETTWSRRALRKVPLWAQKAMGLDKRRTHQEIGEITRAIRASTAATEDTKPRIVFMPDAAQVVLPPSLACECRVCEHAAHVGVSVKSVPRTRTPSPCLTSLQPSALFRRRPPPSRAAKTTTSTGQSPNSTTGGTLLCCRTRTNGVCHPVCCIQLRNGSHVAAQPCQVAKDEVQGGCGRAWR
jgi:hypothetical protein